MLPPPCVNDGEPGRLRRAGRRNDDPTPTLAAAPYALSGHPVSAARRRAATDARMRAQPRHRPDADGRADRQRHERVAPAQRVDQVRHQVDRDQRQREAERGLHASASCPTRARSASSAIDAENCAESATMLMPQTRQTATSHAGSPPNSSPIVAAQLPLTAIATIVIVVRPSRSASKPGADAADRPGRDRRERRELGGRRRHRRRAASARSSRRGTRRSTPTSRRAPTCGRGSRGWRAAAGRRATRSATARGSKRGVGARLGPMPAKRISTAATSALTDATRQRNRASRRRRAR